MPRADNSDMKDLLRTATLVPLPGLIPLGAALMGLMFRPVPVERINLDAPVQ